MSQDLWAWKALYAPTTRVIKLALEIVIHCSNTVDKGKRTLHIFERGHLKKSNRGAANEVRPHRFAVNCIISMCSRCFRLQIQAYLQVAVTWCTDGHLQSVCGVHAGPEMPGIPNENLQRLVEANQALVIKPGSKYPVISQHADSEVLGAVAEVHRCMFAKQVNVRPDLEKCFAAFSSAPKYVFTAYHSRDRKFVFGSDADNSQVSPFPFPSLLV
jgi:hypothetical protein